MWRNIGLSFVKIVGFLLIWALLTAGATMSIVGAGGQDFFFKTPYRVALEVLLAIAVLVALVHGAVRR